MKNKGPPIRGHTDSSPTPCPGISQRSPNRTGHWTASLGLARTSDSRSQSRATKTARRGRAIAPAGASTGQNEALDLRDGGAAFGGLGVDRASGKRVDSKLPQRFMGSPLSIKTAIDRRLIDLDGTPNKARLGANATCRSLDGSAACGGRRSPGAALASGSRTAARFRCRCP